MDFVWVSSCLCVYIDNYALHYVFGQLSDIRNYCYSGNIDYL